ncbi:GNAT family N-acetyltransferase [Streptococcus cuniculipharyngis]|uniref:GNAT family N-acetyltransferase n=1 Tax=Streptococcus cuniculipharyngis TaxID=1562651 RepID=A0A5C5SCQ9_9STRE|nr:GNAT family N-acetyltransferase [Streptococcus cuniculipharyngis]TWS98746.1 GNAT family N-acetyltransferase [Streptococcus cuniculipharyngis]
MIVKISEKDVATLRELAMETYVDTFGQSIKEEDLQTYFATTLSMDNLAAELANPNSQYYFIKQDDEPVGFVKVNQGSAQTEQELENAFEIQRLYIKKDYQGLGLGKKIFEFALDLANKSTCDWVWLGVWEHNYKAQAFYAKYGFEKFGQHEFITGDTVDTDWLLRKPIMKEEQVKKGTRC